MQRKIFTAPLRNGLMVAAALLGLALFTHQAAPEADLAGVAQPAAAQPGTVTGPDGPVGTRSFITSQSQASTTYPGCDPDRPKAVNAELATQLKMQALDGAAPSVVVGRRASQSVVYTPAQNQTRLLAPEALRRHITLPPMPAPVAHQVKLADLD